LGGGESFIFANSALATSYKYDMAFTAIVMNNKSLQIERELMERVYGRRSFVDYGKKKTEEVWGPDFLKIAEAMGGRGKKVKVPEDLIPALKEAMQSVDGKGTTDFPNSITYV